jgi:hypothetical protein
MECIHAVWVFFVGIASGMALAYGGGPKIRPCSAVTAFRVVRHEIIGKHAANANVVDAMGK